MALEGRRIAGEERILSDEAVRWRDVAQGPDGALYLTTDPRSSSGGCSEEEKRSGKLIKLIPRN